MIKKLLGFFAIFYCFTGFSASNYVSIDIDKFDYKRPENNKGNAGNLVFEKVKMSWDDMKISLKNTQSFLDAAVKVRPTYVKFNTPGVGISFPMEKDSFFFDIDKIGLKESRFRLNEDFFNFDGELFSIGDGTSLLVLDKFNMFCNAPEGVDMTGVEGLIHGCLTELVLNGQDETDLAGARIDYYDNSDKENGIFLTSRLKDLKLIDSVFKLDLVEGNLKVSDFDITIGKSYISCKKDKELKELELDELMNGCINNIDISAPEVAVVDKETKSKFDVNLSKMITTEDRLVATLPTVALIDEDTTTFLNDMSIDCKRYKDSEFYDVHQTVAGCIKDGVIKVDNISNLNPGFMKKRSILARWFSGNKEKYTKVETSESQFVNDIDATFINNKLTFFASLKFPYIKRFNLEFEAYVEHDEEAGTISLQVMSFKTMKFITMNKILTLGANFAVGNMENVTVKGNKIIIKI
jgi:hypothetical protein